MDYKEFVERVGEDLKKVLPEEYQGASVSARQVDKLQGASYYGITVQPENSNIGISMDLQAAYNGMEQGRSYEQVLAEVGTAVTEGFENRPQVRASELLDYDSMKEKLMVQVVPTVGNEEMLATVPHVEQEDMSMVYRFVFDTNERGTATTLITNQMLDNYGITAEQLHADAMANAPEQFPASVRSMQEVLADLMGLEPEMMPGEPGGMYVATCNHGMNGAGCIFYPEFMDQAAEKLGGDFFVLPSSVHEVILLPDNGDMSYQDLQNMVQEINATEVQPQDRLSDSVYHYDAQDRVFEKAESHDERQQAKKAEKDRPQEKKSVMNRLEEKKKEAQAHVGDKHAPTKAAENSL
jgi:hypothetical protein